MDNTKKIKCNIDKKIYKNFKKIIKEKGLKKSLLVEELIKNYVGMNTPLTELTIDGILDKIGNYGIGSLTNDEIDFINNQ